MSGIAKICTGSALDSESVEKLVSAERLNEFFQRVDWKDVNINFSICWGNAGLYPNAVLNPNCNRSQISNQDNP